VIEWRPLGLAHPVVAGGFALAALAALAFVAAESRAAAPMLPLGMLRVPAFAGAQIVAFTISSAMFAQFLYLTLYLQNVLGYSPIQAGVRFLPLSMISFFAAPVSGRLSERLPVRFLLGAGMGLVALALYLMYGVHTSSGWTTLLAGFLVGGTGIGMVNPPLASTAVSVVPPQRAGMAAGVNNTFRQVGIATGIAGLGAIFQSALSPQYAHAIAGGAVRGVQARAEFVHGLNDILLVATFVALAGAVSAVALVRRSDFVASAPQHEGAAAA
jgi:predicted MFS family arabinose efflux permease